MASARHLTGAAGRWSATHPWTAILVWLGCVVALLVAGRLTGTIQLPDSQTGSGQTAQAQQMMSRDFPQRANEFVLFESSRLQISAPAYQAAIRDVVTRIQATGRVTAIRSPLDPTYANHISANRHAALKLLGPRNWYLPRWLQWLPRVSSSAPPPTAGQAPKQPVTVP